MATGVLFGSPQTLIRQPGAYSVVDASALNLTPPFAYNIIAVMGAALGGSPMTPYYFNDPYQAQQLFGANTPLAEAVKFAFMGGANGGGAIVVGLRIDNCGQAYGALPAANGGAELSATFKDYGAYGNTYSLSFYPGSVAGTLAVVQGKFLDGRDFIQKFDNETSFSQLIEKINSNSPIKVSIVSGGTSASQTLQIATSQVDGRATITDNQGVARANQTYCYQYPVTMAENATDSVVTSFNSSIAWDISAVDATANTWTTSTAHTLVAGNYVTISGTTLPPEISATKTYIVAASASNTNFQVAEALVLPDEFAVGSLNAGLLTAAGNTLANNDIVQFKGTQIPSNVSLGRNYFVRDKAGDDFRVAATPGGAAIALTGPITALKVVRVAGAAVDFSGTVAGAKVILSPGLTAISGSNPADFNGSRQVAKVRDAYTQVVTNAVITSTAYSSDSARVTLQGAETWGHLTGKGLPGSIFTIATGTYSGTYQVLYQEWDGRSTDKVRVVRKLTGDRVISPGTLSTSFSFYPSFQFGRLQPATDAICSKLPANGLLVNGGQYVTAVVGTKTYYLSTQIGDTIQNVGELTAAQINGDATSPVVASAAYNASTYTSSITLIAKNPGTVANGYPVSILVNVQDTLLCTANGTTLTGGTDPIPPRNAQGVTSGSLILSNGFDSAPTYQRWLDGLKTIKYENVRWIVPAGTDNYGVQVAIADHCTLMSSTPQRRERMCVFGHGAGWTEDQVRARSEAFQSERVVFVSPSRDGTFEYADPITGNPIVYQGYYLAAIVAGMLAAEGNGISDPITHTYLRDIIIRKPYHTGSLALDRLIDSGVLTVEVDSSITRSSRGYRVTRGITTWRVTVNSALKTNQFESINIVNQSDFIAAAIREMEETLFIGKGILPETFETIRNEVNLELMRRSQERVIYGYAPEKTRISRNKDSRNGVDVTYTIYPIPGLEFVCNTQLLAPIPD